MAHPPTHTPSDPSASSPTAIAASQGRVAHPTPELAEAMTRGYEPHDIGLRGVFVFLGGLIASLVVVFAIIFGIMMALVGYDRNHEQAGSVLTAKDVSRGPVYAPLQPSVDHNALDVDDMTEMRRQTQAVLRGEGFGENGRKYIPVEKAMDIVVSKLELRPVVPMDPNQEQVFPTSGRDALHQRGYILTDDPEAAAEMISSSRK